MIAEPDFIQSLKARLQQPLPGEEVQFLMAPVSRLRLKQINPETYRPRPSAVLILLFPENGSYTVVLIKRPEYDGVHSAQVAFPGGRFEEGDQDLAATALREAGEEIGLETANVEILGKLTDLYIQPSNFLVSPYVAHFKQKPRLQPDAREVEQILYADLFSLAKADMRMEKSIVHSDGQKIKTPYYEIGGFTVWGATAMIISELNAVVDGITSS
jgi:8-oxo-dGTP pyrophosphatase MutT (NUDIX family)